MDDEVYTDDDDPLFQLNTAIERFEQDTERHADTINRLLGECPELAGQADEGGEYPLHKAGFYNTVYAISALLEAGAEVDVASENRDRQTPLHLAAHRGAGSALEYLSAAGADLTRRDGQGLTPLMNAIYPQKDAAVGILLRLGAPVDLRAAVGLRQERLVRLLLRDDPAAVHAEPDAASLVGEAAFAGHPGVLRALLEAGADPNAVGQFGHPLQAAGGLGEGGAECVELLRAFGADPERARHRQP